MGRERRYVVRLTLTQGQLAELPFKREERVRAGEVIDVSGWRVVVSGFVASHGKSHLADLT